MEKQATRTDQARIIFDERTVGVWFVHTTEKQDWMAHVRELVPDEKYELVYRFRNYRGDHDKIFDSEDEKRWYSGEIPGTRNYVILMVREMARKMAKMSKLLRMGGESFEYLNDKGIKEFSERFLNAPFVFTRREKKE